MPTVLVVDDDAAIRAMLAKALSTTGATVDQAINGVAALRELGAKKYDLVLLDLHMAGLDGLQVLRIVTSKEGPNRDTPFCVITADGSERVRAESLANRVIMFITKPLRVATLLALVDPVLKRAALLEPPKPGAAGARVAVPGTPPKPSVKR